MNLIGSCLVWRLQKYNKVFWLNTPINNKMKQIQQKRLTSCFTFIEISEVSFIYTPFRYIKKHIMHQLTVCESWFIYPLTTVVFKGPHIDLWTSYLPSLLKQEFLLFSYLRWALQGHHGPLVTNEFKSLNDCSQTVDSSNVLK